jgi:hypothetical protein
MEGQQHDRQETMMIDDNFARLRAHRNNIHRYRRLLSTQLSELERAYIVRRLAEEQSAVEALLETGFPVRSQTGMPSTDAAA